MSELGGAQISNLLETLPGIAQVLRSPVADAFAGVIRVASRSPDFVLAEAEEILRYSVRRNLMSAEESDAILREVQETLRRREERADARAKRDAGHGSSGKSKGGRVRTRPRPSGGTGRGKATKAKKPTAKAKKTKPVRKSPKTKRVARKR